MARTYMQCLVDVATRSYLVDPSATDADLVEMGLKNLASELRHDHKAGRLAQHHAHMTGRRVIVEGIGEGDGAPLTMAGARMSPPPK